MFGTPSAPGVTVVEEVAHVSVGVGGCAYAYAPGDCQRTVVRPRRLGWRAPGWSSGATLDMCRQHAEEREVIERQLGMLFDKKFPGFWTRRRTLSLQVATGVLAVSMVVNYLVRHGWPFM